MEVYQKLKIGLPLDPDKPLFNIHLKKCKSTYKRDTCTPMFITVLFTKPSCRINLGAQQMMNG
jgi:hypothetical protein